MSADIVTNTESSMLVTAGGIISQERADKNVDMGGSGKLNERVSFSVINTCMGGKIKNPELTAKKEQESEMSSTGSMLGLDPSSRQRLIGLAGQKKTSNPFLKMINS